jgi:hypothetical protein
VCVDIKNDNLSEIRNMESVDVHTEGIWRVSENV